MKLSKVERDYKPLRVVTLPPSAFADGWPGKPAVDVAIGLRLIAQVDADRGQREAEREATGFYAQLRETPLPQDPATAVQVFNESVVMHAVALGTCDPNNVTAPYFLAAQDTVKVALTPEGARRLYDELTILHQGSSPARHAATDAEAKLLGRILRAGPILDDEDRKLIAYLLEKRAEAGDVPLPDEDEDDEVESYVAHAAV